MFNNAREREREGRRERERVNVEEEERHGDGKKLREKVNVPHAVSIRSCAAFDLKLYTSMVIYHECLHVKFQNEKR